MKTCNLVPAKGTCPHETVTYKPSGNLATKCPEGTDPWSNEETCVCPKFDIVTGSGERADTLGPTVLKSETDVSTDGTELGKANCPKLTNVEPEKTYSNHHIHERIRVHEKPEEPHGTKLEGTMVEDATYTAEKRKEVAAGSDCTAHEDVKKEPLSVLTMGPGVDGLCPEKESDPE